MKLNIGCGLEYKKGYINIDAFDRSVADQVMSALNLEFEDNSFTQVDCVHVLEHLGAGKSIYALAEVFRVLRPNGLFFLETPDLKSSFKSFLKGNEDQRKYVMNWIYGLDMPGMSHKYGFPEELLERMLQESGFVDTVIKRVNTDSMYPSLRVTCRKSSSKWHQFFTHFRKKLVEMNLVDLNDQVDVIDKESILQDLFANSLTLCDIKAIFELTSTSSPKLGKLYLETSIDENLVTEKMVQNYLSILEELDLLEFPKVMIHLFREMPVMPGQQDETFDAVKSMCSQSIKKILSKEEDTIVELRNVSKKIESEVQTDIFSKAVLNSISQEQLALGAKAFAHTQLEEAITRYRDAVRYNRDNILAYWNLARLRVLNNMLEKGKKCYNITKTLISSMQLKIQRPLVRKLETEINQIAKGNQRHIEQPVLSLLRH